MGAAKLGSVQDVFPWFLNRVPLHSGCCSLVHTLEASLGNLCADETTTNCLCVVVGSWILDAVGGISLCSHTSLKQPDGVDRGCLRHLPQLALLLHLKL